MPLFSTRNIGAALAVALLSFPLATLADGLSLDQLGEIRHVSSVTTAPDGSAVAYVVSIPRDPYEDDGTARSTLHVARSAEDTRAYITGRDDLSNVAWRPDGKAVSFLSECDDSGHQSLYVIPIDGGEAQKILGHENDISAYSWAPDGDSVAFLAREAEDEQRKELSEMGFNARVWEEGHEMVRVWVADLNGEPETRAVDVEGSASSLQWSPTGESLVFMLAPTPLIDDHYMYREIVIADADRGEIVQRFDHSGKKGDPVWSPDGRHIAFVGAVNINDPREGRLMVGDVTGGEYRDIHPDYPGHVQEVAWTDAETLVFVGHVGVFSELARIGRDGQSREMLIDDEQPIMRSLSVAAGDDTIALLADAADHPAELYVLEDGGLERWTDTNPWLADVRLAEQELVRFEARDGLALEGVLVHPLDGRGEPAPTILAIHGGPEAHDSHGWTTSYAKPAQVAAAKGYAMFYPNYRGSTGRGVTFSKLSQGEPAGAEFDDIVDARAHLIETGIAEEGRIGITGRSYGGFASAWGATAQTEYFDASVVAVGAAEQLSKFGTSDITHELYQVHLLTWPWEDWDLFLESSPILHAEQSQTPTLILHGENDARVHVSQGMTLYRYLKLAGQAPVRLVTYPDEAHGTANAAARRDYTMRLMRWMDHFLLDRSDDLPPHELDHSAWLDTE